MRKSKQIGVYKIVSPIGKVYIGQSVDIKKRFRVYKSLHCKSQIRLYRSFLKHGVLNHTFEVLEECSIEKLNDIERHYQDIYLCVGELGLNCKITTTKTKSGYLSIETKKKMSESGFRMSEETKVKIGLANKGKVMSKEQKIKISESQKGRKMSSEQKDKIRNSMLGKKMSEESKRKLSESKKKLSKGLRRNGKTILDFNTGVFYKSLAELSVLLNINRITLYDHVIGKTKNNKFNQYKYV